MKSFRRVCAISVAVLSVSCSEQPVSDTIRSLRLQSGDTTVVRTVGSRPSMRLDSITIVWQSSWIERPQLIWPIDDYLVIVDVNRLHILSAGGEYVGSIGREGAGPGEFRAVAGVGSAGGDTIVVLDAALQRVSFVTADGVLQREAAAIPRPPYVNPVLGSGLVVHSRGVLSLWSENLQQERPTLTALLWRDLVADTIAVVETWPGATWSRIGDFVVQNPLFGPQVVVAMAADGSAIAVGSGVEYCVTIILLAEPRLQRVCREQAQVSVGPELRRPDLTRVENESRRAALATLVREQQIARHLPSYDRLLLDGEGRLWVRIPAAEEAHVHPYVRRYYPEREPVHRHWDVYDRAGEFLGALEIPARFIPHVIFADRMLGFLELESGELVVAAAKVPFN